jgi:hypothetical protein
MLDTVLDIIYRALMGMVEISRTGIYRFMGGKRFIRSLVKIFW